MDPAGSIDEIIEAATAIYHGRKGFATIGKAEERHLSYERGISVALSAFKDASNFRFASTADPETIILAEYTFLAQEIEFCEKTNTASLNSMFRILGVDPTENSSLKQRYANLATGQKGNHAKYI